MDDVSGVRKIAQQLIRDMYSGKVHPRVGVGVAPLLNLLLRANQIKDNKTDKTFAQIIWAARERAGLPHDDADSGGAPESGGKP
jgi:hypothetical protein